MVVLGHCGLQFTAFSMCKLWTTMTIKMHKLFQIKEENKNEKNAQISSPPSKYLTPPLK